MSGEKGDRQAQEIQRDQEEADQSIASERARTVVRAGAALNRLAVGAAEDGGEVDRARASTSGTATTSLMCRNVPREPSQIDPLRLDATRTTDGSRTKFRGRAPVGPGIRFRRPLPDGLVHPLSGQNDDRGGRLHDATPPQNIGTLPNAPGGSALCPP